MSNSPFALTPFTPHPGAPTLAIQFRGDLDSESATPRSLALAHTSNPARTPDLSLTGTFAGFPVRSETYRRVQHATIPASVAATLHLAPDTVPAVLVPTPSGGVPAFPGDWIVQAADGTYSVWSDEKFRAGFDVPASADGSGTGRYGAHGNWTEHGDGKDYPAEGASYGVPQNTELKPFAPFEVAPDTFGVGTYFRILNADQSVDPKEHVATAVHDGLVTYYTSPGVTAEVSRDHVVAVKAEPRDILS